MHKKPCKIFTCEHRKIIFPLLTVATRENKFSLLTREIKNNSSMNNNKYPLFLCSNLFNIFYVNLRNNGRFLDELDDIICDVITGIVA